MKKSVVFILLVFQVIMLCACGQKTAVSVDVGANVQSKAKSPETIEEFEKLLDSIDLGCTDTEIKEMVGEPLETKTYGELNTIDMKVFRYYFNNSEYGYQLRFEDGVLAEKSKIIKDKKPKDEKEVEKAVEKLINEK